MSLQKSVEFLRRVQAGSVLTCFTTDEANELADKIERLEKERDLYRDYLKRQIGFEITVRGNADDLVEMLDADLILAKGAEIAEGK